MSRAKPRTSSGSLIRKRKEPSGRTEVEKGNGEKNEFPLDVKILRRAAEERTREKSAARGLNENSKMTSARFPAKESIVKTTMDLQKGSWSEIPQSFKDGSADETGGDPGGLHAIRVVWLVRAFHEGDAGQRQEIAAALAASPLVTDAISDLKSESREKTYVAFSLLFTLAKSGHLQPLLKAVQTHPNIEVRLELVKLLALSQHPDVVPALRVLASATSVDPEVRSAAEEAISQTPNPAGWTAS